VELQTLSQKIALPFKAKIDYVESFEADQKFDGIVEHDVRELGNHMYIFYIFIKRQSLYFMIFYHLAFLTNIFSINISIKKV